MRKVPGLSPDSVAHLFELCDVVFGQVVLRNGVPIDAEVPDYRELDTVPNERRYTADQPVLTLGPADPPSNPPRSPSSGSITSNDAAFSKQPPVDERDSVIAALNAKVS